MKRIFLLFFLKSFLIFQFSFSKKSEAPDDQWTEIESREESLSRFNWVVRKEDQRNAYIYYMEIVDIEKSLEAIKITFDNKSSEVAEIFKSFIEKLHEIIIDINKDFKNFDDLEKESQKIIDKIFSFDEKKIFLDDKDSKKRIAILQQKGNDLKLRVNNIVNNIGLIESSKNNLVNSIEQLDKVLKKIKDYENSSWNLYLKFDELISDSVAKNLIDSIKNNLENAKQKNNFVRGDFLNFFNSVIKNIAYAMNYIEKDFNSFNDDRVSILSEIKIIEDLIKTREKEKEKLEEEELRIQEIERIKRENEMKLKALAQRPWYIKTKDYLSFIFEKINKAFSEGYKLASNTFSSLTGKNKNNLKNVNTKIENKNKLLDDELKFELNKESEDKEILVSSNEEVKEEIKFLENNNEVQDKNIFEVKKEKKNDDSKDDDSSEDSSSDEKKADEIKSEDKIEPEKSESEIETEEKKNSESTNSSEEDSSKESDSEEKDVAETPDLAENKLPTTEAIKDDESSDENEDSSSDSNDENSQNNFVQDIPSQQNSNDNNSDDNNSENKDDQNNDDNSDQENDSSQQDFDPSTEAAAKNFSSYSRGGQNNEDQDGDDYDDDDYYDDDDNRSPFVGAIKEYAENKLIRKEEKKKEKKLEKKDTNSNDEKKNNNDQKRDQEDENDTKDIDTKDKINTKKDFNDNNQKNQTDENDTKDSDAKDKINTKKIIKGELEKKEILNIEQKGKKSKKEDKKIPFRKKRR